MSAQNKGNRTHRVKRIENIENRALPGTLVVPCAKSEPRNLETSTLRFFPESSDLVIRLFPNSIKPIVAIEPIVADQSNRPIIANPELEVREFAPAADPSR